MMTNIYLICVTSMLISCVSSQYEEYPPDFKDPDPRLPTIKEGNYTDNSKYVFTVKARVLSRSLNVTIKKVQSEETSDMIRLNCTYDSDGVNCLVYLIASVDRERTQTLQFRFIAKSSNENAQPAYQTVSLNLDDVNDESPVFHSPSYQIILPENYTVNSAVTEVTISATDPDAGVAGQVFYYIEPSGQAASLYRGYIDINNGTGVLILRKELDYEELSFLQYTLIAKDGGGDNQIHSSTAQLLVKVEDVQDKPPIFIGLPYVKSVPENSNGEILEVRAIDGDLGIPRSVIYGTLNGSCAEYLNISESGVITAVKTLDRDKGEIKDVRGVCFIDIEAYEVGVTPSNLTRSTTKFALTVEDINDNAPTFKKTNYSGRVAENATISISFDENIVVEDTDQNNHNKMQVTVYDLNMTVYKGIEVSPSEIIGKGIVLLRVNTSFDYEEQKSVDLVLKAEDVQNVSLYSICYVHVAIIDTNDNDPKFISEEYIFNVTENSCNGTLIGLINATDRDSGEFGEVFYHLSGTRNRFAINASSGEIFVATDKGCNCTGTDCEDSDLNWEKNPVYYLTAEAQDRGGRRSSVPVEIHLTDKNDNAPEFRYSDYETSIKEKSTTFSSGKKEFTVKATDGDEINSINSQISYCFVDDDNACINHTHFYINKTGSVSCIKELDYEEIYLSPRGRAGELTLKIKAYDHGSPGQFTVVNMTILVQDENDNNPTFNQTHKGCVEENSETGTSVLTVSAYDSDGTAPNNEISYFIFSGGSDQFSMDGSSGVISVQIGAKLDRESVPKYDITVIAIDRGNPQRNGTTNVTVDILDVNDTPPRFLNLPNEKEVEENSTDLFPIFNVSCYDNDTISELEYSIQVAEVDLIDRPANDTELLQYEDYFSIEKSTGFITSSPKVDAEKVSSVVLNVTVIDKKTEPPYENSSMAQLRLVITDKNDNPPVFLQKSLSAGILRESVINTVVYDLKEYVRDADSSAENRTHTFSFNVYKDLNINDVGSGCSHSFCVTTNGTVYSNVLFTGKGYAKLNISANDTAGTDYTLLDIYVIDESQQLSMHFLMQTNAVYKVKDIVLEKLAGVLGYKCVFDKVEQYRDDNNNLKEHESLLTFHVLDEPTNTVLEAVVVESLLDKRGDSLKDIRDEFAVQSIGALTIKDPLTNDNKIKETYILVAVIVLLTLILGIIIYFYIVSNTRFKRKLKAATIPTAEKNKENLGQPYLPGSNVFSSTKNPLVDKDDEVKRTINEFDRASLAESENSLDYNEIEYAKRNHDNDNPIEEKEVIMDMYGDDGVIQNDSDDDLMLLKQAVEQHEKTSPLPRDKDTSNRFDVMNGKVNESYQIVESTDV